MLVRVPTAKPQISLDDTLESDLAMSVTEITSCYDVHKRSLLPLDPRADAWRGTSEAAPHSRAPRYSAEASRPRAVTGYRCRREVASRAPSKARTTGFVASSWDLIGATITEEGHASFEDRVWKAVCSSTLWAFG